MGFDLGSAAGGIAGGVLGFIGQQQTNQKNWDIAQSMNAASAEQAQKQMDFQERMRESQYQTAVEDLKKAGLNPMLAYTQGGAGVPAGAMGAVSSPQFKSPISSAKEAAAAIANSYADVVLKGEQATATTAQAEVSRTSALQNIANTAKVNQDEKTSAAVEKVNQEQLKVIAEDILLKAQQTRTTATQAALNKAHAKESETKTKGELAQEPWWVSSAKDAAKSFSDRFETLKQNMGFDYKNPKFKGK